MAETRQIAREPGVGELEHVIARHIEHRLLDRLERQFAGRVHQAELHDLLVCGDQVAFDFGRDEAQGLGRGALFLPRQAFADPCWQGGCFDRFGFDQHAGRVERLDPGGLHGLVVTGEGHQQQRAAGIGLGESGDFINGAAPFLARFAGGDAQVDQRFVAEQRHAGQVGLDLAPVEIRARRVDLAVGEAGSLGTCTDGVGRLKRSQLLGTGDGVERGEALAQVGIELLWG